MSRVCVLEDGGEWQVWIGLEDANPPEGLSFIIGVGQTRDDAVAEAVADLERAVADLQLPVGI